MSENWIGKKMMNPNGEVGKVIKVRNPTKLTKEFTVKFKNKTEKFILNLAGDVPEESKHWKWLLTRREWIEWGEFDKKLKGVE